MFRVGQAVGLYTERPRDLLKPFDRHPHFTAFDAAVPAGGHAHLLSHMFLGEVFEFGYLFDFHTDRQAVERVLFHGDTTVGCESGGFGWGVVLRAIKRDKRSF